MKVAVNSRIFQSQKGGIPYYVRLLYTELSRQFPGDEYVFLQTSKKPAIGDTRTVDDRSPGKNKMLFDLIWAHLLLSREKGVAVFHSPIGIIPLFKKRSVKYVITIHDLAFELFPKNNGWLFNTYYHWSLRWAVRRADVIVAMSENTKKDIVELYKVAPHRIHVVYSGINQVYFDAPKSPRIIKEKYFFSLTTHPFRKNISSVLDVLATRPASLRGLKYVIAGIISDEPNKALKEKIKGLGLQNDVVLFGYATEEQLANLYQHAEFFIYPSFYEGFGFPILEAMLCKCPVITSNTSSMKELVPDWTWLIDPKSTGDIQERMDAIMGLSLGRRHRLVEANYDFAAKFTWDSAAKKIHDLFLSA